MTEDVAHVEQLDTQLDETESNRSHHSSLSSNSLTSEDSLELEAPETHSQEDTKGIKSVLKYKKVALGSRSHSEDSLELSHLTLEDKNLDAKCVKVATVSQPPEVNDPCRRERRSSGQSTDSLEIENINHLKDNRDKSDIPVEEVVANERKFTEDIASDLKSESCPKSEFESFQHRQETRRLLSSYSESESFESSQLGSYETDDPFLKDNSDNFNANIGKSSINDHDVGLKDTICPEKEQKVTESNIDKECFAEEAVYAEIFGDETESSEEIITDSNNSVSELKVKKKQEDEQGRIFHCTLESDNKPLTDNSGCKEKETKEDCKTEDNEKKELDSCELSSSSLVRPDTYGGCDPEDLRSDIKIDAEKKPDLQDSCVKSEAEKKTTGQEVGAKYNSSQVDFKEDTDFDQFQQYEEHKPEDQSLTESTLENSETKEIENASEKINNNTIPEIKNSSENRVEQEVSKEGLEREQLSSGSETQEERIEPLQELGSPSEKPDIEDPHSEEFIDTKQGSENSEAVAIELKDQGNTSDSEKENQNIATDRKCSYSYLEELANDEKGIYRETTVIHDLPEDQVNEKIEDLKLNENTELIDSSKIKSEIAEPENSSQIKDSSDSDFCQIEQKFKEGISTFEQDTCREISDSGKETLSDTEEDIHAKENTDKQDNSSICETFDSEGNNLPGQDSPSKNSHPQKGCENILDRNCTDIHRTSREHLEVIFESECVEDSSTDNQQNICTENNSTVLQAGQSSAESSDTSKDHSLDTEEPAQQDKPILEQGCSDKNSAPDYREDIEVKLEEKEGTKKNSDQSDSPEFGREQKQKNIKEQLSVEKELTVQAEVRKSVSVSQEEESALSTSGTESVEIKVQNTGNICSEILDENQHNKESVLEKSESPLSEREGRQSKKNKTQIKSRLPVKKAGKEHPKQLPTESPIHKIVKFTEEDTEIESHRQEEYHTDSIPKQTKDSESFIKETNPKGNTTGSEVEGEKDQPKSTGHRGRSLKKSYSVADPTTCQVPNSEKPVTKSKKKLSHQRSKSLDTNSWYKKHTAPLSQGLTFEEKFKFYWGQRTSNQTKPNPVLHQAKEIENQVANIETAAKMFAPPKKGTPEPQRARSASRDKGTPMQRKKWDLEDKKFESIDNAEFDRIEGTISYAGNGSIYKTRNPRETSTSQKRKESIKLAQMLATEADRDPEDYRTPFQRKDDTIRELRIDLKEAHEALALKEDQIHEIVRQKDMKSVEIIEEKDQELFNLREQLHEINEKYLSLKTAYEEAAIKLEKAEKRFQDAKEYMTKKETEHQEMYYQMYQKGIKTAEYERQEHLAEIAHDNPQEVAVSELAKKLAITQSQLERWQTLRREECYQEACKPETQADATLFFLRDSMFHYLTGNTKDDPERHMQAMIGIFGFTEVQMKKIKLAQDKKNKKKH